MKLIFPSVRNYNLISFIFSSFSKYELCFL